MSDMTDKKGKLFKKKTFLYKYFQKKKNLIQCVIELSFQYINIVL